MFSDLKKGFQVHTLDTNTVPKYELGKVVAVSEPRYLPPQPGQYQAMQTRVVDLTVELTGETNTRPDAILTYRVFILIHIVLF